MSNNLKSFQVDSRIASTCFELGDGPASRIFLKDNAHYPWIILVPRHSDAEDLLDIPPTTRYQVMDEISTVSAVLQAFFKPDKINVATLGNLVRQLHIHVVVRFVHDELWPHGIWQAMQTSTPYTQDVLNPLLRKLKDELQSILIY